VTGASGDTTLPGTVSTAKPGLRLTFHSQVGCGLIGALTITSDASVTLATELSPWITDASIIWHPDGRRR
jgi:hypothetical protein